MKSAWWWTVVGGSSQAVRWVDPSPSKLRGFPNQMTCTTKTTPQHHAYATQISTSSFTSASVGNIIPIHRRSPTNRRSSLLRMFLLISSELLLKTSVMLLIFTTASSPNFSTSSRDISARFHMVGSRPVMLLILMILVHLIILVTHTRAVLSSGFTFRQQGMYWYSTRCLPALGMNHHSVICLCGTHVFVKSSFSLLLSSMPLIFPYALNVSHRTPKVKFCSHAARAELLYGYQVEQTVSDPILDGGLIQGALGEKAFISIECKDTLLLIVPASMDSVDHSEHCFSVVA